MSGVDRLAEVFDRAAAVRAARSALEGGAEVWLVGGAVRNAALGREVRNLDLAAPEDSEEGVARRIADQAGGYAFALSERYSTWRAVSPGDGWHVDVTAVQGGSIEADLARRDFTVDAVAVPVAGGELVDPHGGLADARARLLRAVGLDCFQDDPLRLLRLARIAATFQLKVDPGTIQLARAAASRAGEPAGERQFAELRGILAGPDPLRGLDLLDQADITATVLPELEATRGVIQNPNHHLDVHGHTLAVLEQVIAIEGNLERFAGEWAEETAELLAEPFADELTRGEALRFGALVHDLGKPETREERGEYVTFIGHDEVGAEIVAGICARLRTSRALRDYLQGVTRHHLRLGFLIHERPLSRRRVYDYLRATEPVSADVTLLSAADRLSARGSGAIAGAEMVEAHLDLAREMLAAALDWHRDGPPQPPLSGDELAAELGIEPGPKLGRLLEELRAATYAGEISTRAEAVDLARELR
jgi:poly(A) polymerase